MDHVAPSVRNKPLLFIELAIVDAHSTEIHCAKNRKGGNLPILWIFYG
jgi:hypothetical protein